MIQIDWNGQQGVGAAIVIAASAAYERKRGRKPQIDLNIGLENALSDLNVLTSGAEVVGAVKAVELLLGANRSELIHAVARTRQARRRGFPQAHVSFFEKDGRVVTGWLEN